MMIPIENADFSVFTYRKLKRAGINSVNKLKTMTETEIKERTGIPLYRIRKEMKGIIKAGPKQ